MQDVRVWERKRSDDCSRHLGLCLRLSPGHMLGDREGLEKSSVADGREVIWRTR